MKIKLSLPPGEFKGLGASPAIHVGAIVTGLKDRAGELLKTTQAMDPSEQKQLIELEARVVISENRDRIIEEIHRKRKIAAYRQAIDDTNTLPITKKSTELTKELVTDQLQLTFKTELRNMDFTHLSVEVQAAGGTKGALFHKVVFGNAPGVTVTNVLSEGEARALSLAAFLTELSTAPTPSGIIFDDPVSSLDHIWRERIGKRLVAEAKVRQVVVFTHDLVFLHVLLEESEKRGVDCARQFVRNEGLAGVCSPDLPWVAMPVNDRIGKLRARAQTAEKTLKTEGQDGYEREVRDMFGLLREAWEQALAEVLLNGVVERYRPSIETQRARCLHDITEVDLKTVENAMKESSRWIRGHDPAPADVTPLPTVDAVKKSIQDLDEFVKAIRRRRK